jgi:LTXXQ motif family protein
MKEEHAMQIKPVPALWGLALAGLFALTLAAPAHAHDRGGEWRDPWGAPPWMWGAIPPQAAVMAGFGNPCAGLGVHWIARAASFAGGLMDLKPEQEAALQSLEDVNRDAGARLADICGGDDAKATAPERLKRQDEALSAARDALGRVRPKFEAFYNTLAPRQKEVMDDVIAGRRPIPWGWWYQDR